MITCRSCGAGVPDSSHVCSRCGARQENCSISDETVRIDPVAVPAGGGIAAAVAPSGSPARSGVPSSTSYLNTSATADEGRFLPGTLIAGRYRMIELLGRGGMGEVYRATDLTLAQSVALKFLPNAADNQRLLERFHNEVRIARQVSHANVCRVYDIGEAEGMPFISMEYVDGEDLASLLQRIGRLPCDKALDITRKLCAGLASAHERGIIHRDLKPANIMLNRRGEVVIMDFGLAAVAAELRGLEARDGTPAWMSPEQLRGDVVTPKSDIYALGLIIYELFCGRRAFDATTLAELLQQQEARTPVSLTTLVADVDPVIEKVVLRCLDPDPTRRPPGALAVAAALPGGDPLSAALAAGEMPSPELVAASGKAEGIAPKYAVACLAIVLVCLLTAPFIKANLMLESLATPELSPAVLEHKAREIAATLGHEPVLRDRFRELAVNKDLIKYFSDKHPGVKDWRTLLHGESPYRLHYRQSPRPLLSPPDGEITLDRPAMDVPGMLMVVTDGRGQLRAFDAVIAASQPAPAVPIDPAVVFRTAGLDIAQFSETEPKRVPVLAFDKRQAWVGKHPALHDTDIRVELATWRGLPVSFQVVWPFSKEPEAEDPNPGPQTVAVQTLSILSITCGLFCSVYFARQNLRRGRGDRVGALKLACFVAGGQTVALLLAAHYVPSLNSIGYLFANICWMIALGVLLWVGYVALEPMIRSTWPQSLITWNRVLAGNIADARVGSHILIGAAAGMIIHSAVLWRIHWRIQSGGSPSVADPGYLDSTGQFLATCVQTFSSAALTSLIIFFVLCGFRALLRRDWLAAIVAAFLLTLQEGGITDSPNFGLDIALYVFIFAVFAFMLLRMGLVPAISGIVFINMGGRIATAPDFLNWINGPAVTQLLVLMSIALFAFWRSQVKPDPGFS